MAARTRTLFVRTTLVLLMATGPMIARVAAQERAPAATATPATPVAISTPAAEIVKAVAWPVTAALIALVFWAPLSVFLRALGSRVTKLSVFKVELELVPATAAAAVPLVDDIRGATTSAEISDSSRMMLEQVQAGTPADYAMIQVGTGDEWLTSRLFIAAAMLERMRNVQVLVFVETTPAAHMRFVAVAPVRVVRWALAQRFPHLEAAWARAYLPLFPQQPRVGVLPPEATWLPDPRTMTAPQPIIRSDTGAVDTWQARQVVAGFINSLQRPGGAPPSDDWVVLGGAIEERAEWVTTAMLREMLPPETSFAWMEEGRDAPRAARTRAVLRRAAPYVALTAGDREFVRLVNRKTLLEDIAASLGEETGN